MAPAGSKNAMVPFLCIVMFSLGRYRVLDKIANAGRTCQNCLGLIVFSLLRVDRKVYFLLNLRPGARYVTMTPYMVLG